MHFYLLLKIMVEALVVNTQKNFLIVLKNKEQLKLQQMRLKLLQREQFKKQQKQLAT